MRKFLIVAVLAAAIIASGAVAFAAEAKVVQATTQVTTQTQPVSAIDKKLRIEAYAEYINFTGGAINNNTWGGGVLARYLFLDWLGAQTNVTFYGDIDPKDIGRDMSLTNWRLSLLFHTYAPDIDPKLYGYAGGGLGVQFNGDVGDVKVKDALTGHFLLGVGYDITEILNLEAEVGYQFGRADTDNYTDNNVDLKALYVRAGAGIRF